jgi:Cu(I)/Ag(I) efflux system membrane fusion protein
MGSPFLLRLAVPIVLLFAVIAVARAQGVRDRTRLTPRGSTSVTEAQAGELTLTLTQVAVRPIQVWVRTAGVVDGTGTVVTAAVSPAEGAFVRVGQRVRAFPPESRAWMYLARISRVLSQGNRVLVQATLAGPGRQGSTRYVLEILTDRGALLSVPNEAILETGSQRLVYVRQPDGGYAPREVRTGIQGELFTEVLEGLTAGQQVVTTGSFFIHAEHTLKGGQ